MQAVQICLQLNAGMRNKPAAARLMQVQRTPHTHAGDLGESRLRRGGIPMEEPPLTACSLRRGGGLLFSAPQTRDQLPHDGTVPQLVWECTHHSRLRPPCKWDHSWGDELGPVAPLPTWPLMQTCPCPQGRAAWPWGSAEWAGPPSCTTSMERR